MKRVVIVEDEKLVLLGIKSLFTNQNEYSVIGSFTHAHKAIQFIRGQHPDIVLTDIRMPQMNGITLIQEIKKESPGVHIVVLSCLDEFDTVSRAFKLGIDDYLLKHDLEKKNLFQVLDSIQVMPQQNYSDNTVHTDGENQSSSEIKDFFEFSALLASVDSSEKNTEQNSAISHKQYFSSDTLIVTALIFKHLYLTDSTVIQQSIDPLLCINLIDSQLTQSGAGKVFIKDLREILIVLEGDPEYQEKRMRFFKAIQKDLSNYFNGTYLLCRSKPYPIHSILDAYREAKELYQRHGFYHHTSRIISSSRVTPEKRVREVKLPDAKALLLDKTNAWRHDMLSYLSYNKQHRIPQADLCMQLLLYWQQLEHWAEEAFQWKLEPIRNEHHVFEILRTIDDFYHLKTWFLTLLDRIHDDIIQNHIGDRITGKVVFYIHEHYSEHITLTSLAEQFHLNPNYICEVFKRETQINFTDYLNRVRIDHAQELLLSGNLTSDQICHLTGFSNPSHFSKVFKRITGMTATEYRQRKETSSL